MASRNVSAMGEFGLIEALGRLCPRRGDLKVGVGDDAAVFSGRQGVDYLFTTDMLIEGRHFQLGRASASEIGRKALAVNLSDIAAMGGEPLHAVAAVGLPQTTPIRFVRQMYAGMQSLARRYDVSLAGGDTNRSERLIVSVALIGQVKKNKAVLRSGARAGDVLFVSGPLGGSYASKRHLNFEPRFDAARFLTGRFRVHSMIDLSDGLSSDVNRICQASRVGAFISAEAVPLNRETSLRGALQDGEDFELLFSLAPQDAARLTISTEKTRLRFYPIGKIVPKRFGIRLVRGTGGSEPLEPKGFDHFR